MVDILLPRPLPGAMGEPSKSKCAQHSGTRGRGGRAGAGPCGSSSAPPLPSGARADSAGKGCGLGPWQLWCRYSRPCPALPGPAGPVPYPMHVLSAVPAAELISFGCFHFFLCFPQLFLPFFLSLPVIPFFFLYLFRVSVCLFFPNFSFRLFVFVWFGLVF